VNPENKTLVLHRWSDDTKLVCLMNFSAETGIVNLDGGSEWSVLLYSADPQWGGSGHAAVDNDVIRLHPESILVLEK
jgi:hypothetical protein